MEEWFKRLTPKRQMLKRAEALTMKLPFLSRDFGK